MIIGFLGKGGSGKSTLATEMTRFLHERGDTVLAIDADHNMDLAYNLGFTGNGPYIGGSFLALRKLLGVSYNEKTEALFTDGIPAERFSFSAPDPYSLSHMVMLKPRLFLMMSGPQSEEVLYGSHCSHSLAAALKIYLPLLVLAPREYAIVDEKASVDAVTTGIPTGFDLAVIVMEPREHSIRVAREIARLLDWYDIPHILALNKAQDTEDTALVEEAFGYAPDLIFPTIADPLSPEHREAFARIATQAEKVSVTNETRLLRTARKYQRNQAHFAGA